jgi:hypothetical protein
MLQYAITMRYSTSQITVFMYELILMMKPYHAEHQVMKELI